MSVAPTWSGPPAKTEGPTRTLDPEAYAMGRVLATLIGLGAATAPRSQQNAIGSSELGHACDRRLAYRLAGIAPTNVRDPLVTLMGTGWHAVMAELFTRLNVWAPGRFLVEYPVVYRDTPGTLDLYDRETKTVIDWKSSTLDKISHMKSQGPASPYITQGQTYGAGLREAGFEVRHIALVFVPRDGKTLDQIWVWRTPFDPSVADAAIDRLLALQGTPPERTDASPDRLCGWCSHYLPESKDLGVGCPGDVHKGLTRGK